jgi:hypothetical protein
MIGNMYNEFSLAKFNRMRSCSHLKGGRPMGRRSDYAVTIHTFIDGSQRIKCILCGWTVWNHPDWRFKWAVGMKMVKTSTNTPTSSQIMLQVMEQKIKSGEICAPVTARIKVFQSSNGTINTEAEWD